MQGAHGASGRRPRQPGACATGHACGAGDGGRLPGQHEDNAPVLGLGHDHAQVLRRVVVRQRHMHLRPAGGQPAGLTRRLAAASCCAAHEPLQAVGLPAADTAARLAGKAGRISWQGAGRTPLLGMIMRGEVSSDRCRSLSANGPVAFSTCAAQQNESHRETPWVCLHRMVHPDAMARATDAICQRHPRTSQQLHIAQQAAGKGVPVWRTPRWCARTGCPAGARRAPCHARPAAQAGIRGLGQGRRACATCMTFSAAGAQVWLRPCPQRRAATSLHHGHAERAGSAMRPAVGWRVRRDAAP